MRNLLDNPQRTLKIAGTACFMGFYGRLKLMQRNINNEQTVHMCAGFLGIYGAIRFNYNGGEMSLFMLSYVLSSIATNYLIGFALDLPPISTASF